MTGACSPASLATSVKCAEKGRPEGAGFGWAFTSRVAIPCVWLKSFCAEAHKENSTNERRVIVIKGPEGTHSIILADSLLRKGLLAFACGARGQFDGALGETTSLYRLRSPSSRVACWRALASRLSNSGISDCSLV